MAKKRVSPRFLKIAVAAFVTGLAAIIAASVIMNNNIKKDFVSATVNEIVTAANEDSFVIGVIKSEGAEDNYVVINSETGEEIIVPSSLTEIITGQDAGEMRGGITVLKNGFGEITDAKMYVPEDAVMREYKK